ncbi:hypothetical protein AMECASPLE_033212 [Ameca splendens]|uniref:Uncharacterized protein n=1 Tax=Ameca splendens TaxID=208324 RepID=A0ABV0ZRP0_9TELE
MVKILLGAGADPAVLDRHGQTALHLCCEYQQLDCLSVLLSLSSSSPWLEIRNFEGLSPLHLAVLQGCQDLAKMLLDAGADINAMDIKSGQSPLMHAVESNNPDMVDFLIEHDTTTTPRTRRTLCLLLHPGPGRGGSRLSRDAQTSLSPDTSSSSSRGSPRRSQASRET